MKKKTLLSVIILLSIFTMTGCGKSDKDKLIKYLENNEFKCNVSSEKAECAKEDRNIKKTFIMDTFIEYEETIYDSGTIRLVTNIQNYYYEDNENNDFIGIIEASFKGTDLMNFYAESCENSNSDCFLHIGEKVYPAPKKEYEEYKEYFSSGKDKEYLNALRRNQLSLSEELRLETIYENYSAIKDNDKFTKNVNDALRYFEKTLYEAGITLGE